MKARTLNLVSLAFLSLFAACTRSVVVTEGESAFAKNGRRPANEHGGSASDVDVSNAPKAIAVEEPGAPEEILGEVKVDTEPFVAPTDCPSATALITEEDNSKVFSEWGHLIANKDGNGFVRIVKNAATSGYGAWYCQGVPPNNGNFKSHSCWNLGNKTVAGDASDEVKANAKGPFYPKATDQLLRHDCGLLGKLKDNGIKLPLFYQAKLIAGPYPVQFEIEETHRTTLCTVAAAAFNACLSMVK